MDLHSRNGSTCLTFLISLLELGRYIDTAIYHFINKRNTSVPVSIDIE